MRLYFINLKETSNLFIFNQVFYLHSPVGNRKFVLVARSPILALFNKCKRDKTYKTEYPAFIESNLFEHMCMCPVLKNMVKIAI